jgi:hypothetical protein
MSTDDTQPSQTPARRSQQQHDYQEPPTVAAPAQPGPDSGTDTPREEATRAVPRYAAPPPPPPPPPGSRSVAPQPADPQPAEAGPAEADGIPPGGGGDVPPDATRRDVPPDATRREVVPDATRLEAVPSETVREPAAPERAAPARSEPDQWQQDQWRQDQWQREQPGPAESGQGQPDQWQHNQWQQGAAQPGQGQPAAWQQNQWQERQDGPPRQWSGGAGGDGQAGPGGQWAPPPQGQGPGYQGPGQAGQPQRGRRPRRRRVRRSVMALFAVIVVLIVLVIADRVACAITENEFASQIQSDGLGVRPSVNIEGFPFLTQLASKDFNKVDLDASNVPAGPVTISTVHAVINGMHISSFSSSASAKVDHMTATAFISFGSIMSGLGLDTSTGISTKQDGPDKIKITAGIGGIASDTEEAQITQTGPQTISIKLLDTGGLGSLLGNGASFSFNLPKGVPASLRITNLSLNSQGLTVSAAASNATLSK